MPNITKHELDTILNALPPINFDYNNDHEKFAEYLYQLISRDAIDKLNPYEFFFSLYPEIESGELNTTVINGSLLYIRNKLGLASVDLKIHDMPEKLHFFFKDRDATFIINHIVICVKGFTNPISEIHVQIRSENMKYSDLNFTQRKYILYKLMQCIATILTWHYMRQKK